MRVERISDACHRVGDKQAAFRAKVTIGTRPRSIKIGVRSVGWLVPELDAVVRAQAAGLSEDELRELVRELHALRGEAPTERDVEEFARRFIVDTLRVRKMRIKVKGEEIAA